MWQSWLISDSRKRLVAAQMALFSFTHPSRTIDIYARSEERRTVFFSLLNFF